MYWGLRKPTLLLGQCHVLTHCSREGIVGWELTFDAFEFSSSSAITKAASNCAA